MPTVRIDGDRIDGYASFHTVFSEALGFPGFYGRNMDAWIDCLTSLDAPEDGMTTVHVTPPDVLVLHVENAHGLKQRCPDVLEALLECSAFVNYRRIDRGEPAVLAISLWA